MADEVPTWFGVLQLVIFERLSKTQQSNKLSIIYALIFMYFYLSVIVIFESDLFYLGSYPIIILELW